MPSYAFTTSGCARAGRRSSPPASSRALIAVSKSSRVRPGIYGTTTTTLIGTGNPNTRAATERLAPPSGMRGPPSTEAAADRRRTERMGSGLVTYWLAVGAQACDNRYGW
jgi:hypothetical protein